MKLARMFIFAIWVTLCIWAYVEHAYEEKYTLRVPEIIVVPHPEQLGE